MANYDIPQYPTKRLRYFNNQFLIDQDFIDDDAAQIGHERAFLRSLCVAGVCEGLQVTYPATNLPPSVSPGVAIDKAGRMIVVDQATSALARPDALADGDYFIHISFLEIEDAKATGQGAPDFTRWKQTPVINATAKSAALPDGAVVLGSCTVKNKAFVGAGATVGRQYSGLRLPGPNQNTAATLRNNGAADDLAVLGGSLTIRRDAGGQVGPTLTLLNDGRASGAGGAIDFNGYDPGTNDPTLRIRSLDANFSSHLTFWTKQSGAAANKLVERLRLTSDGMLKFPVDSGDKIIIKDNGTTDRYGIGLNDSNINLFCPTTARFSLRQNSSSGTEVFSVNGSGTVTFSGPIDGSLKIRRDARGDLGPTLTLLNGSTGGAGAGGAIDFNGYDPGTNDPTVRIRSLDDGNASSHLAFFTKTTGNPANNLVERLRLTNTGNLGIGTQTPNDILHVLHADTVGTFESSTIGAAIRLVTSEGMNNQVQFANRSGGNAAIWVGTAGDALTVKKDGGVVVSKATGGVGDLTVENYLRFPNEAPKDKIVLWDNGTTDRFGIGLNGSNINLFYPTNARFSLRQNSNGGTEVFSVDGSGKVTLSGPIQNSLTVRRDVSGQIGPTLTLLNSSGGTNAGGAIDFNGNDPGSGNDPMLRIQSLDSGNWSSHLTFSTKASGANTNKLVERLRLTSDGLLKFPNESTKEKIVLWDNGTTDRFGIGLNSDNINLFYPTTARFSLRQNSNGGTEVFSVDGSGKVTFSGSIQNSLTVRRDVSGQLGPTLTLFNGSGATNAGGAIDFNGYDPGTNDPTLRIRSLDDGNSSSHLTFSTKSSGAATNKLVERLRLTSDGVLRFPNVANKDKIILWDNYGMGLSDSNINLFYPTGARFSLRKNSTSGSEIFSVDSSGNGQMPGNLLLNSVEIRGTYGGSVQMTYVGDNDSNRSFVISYLARGGNAVLAYKLGWGFNSDAALKTNIVAHEPVLDRVMQLRPVRFTWKADGDNGSGFIAQEVEALFPDLVHEGLVDETVGRRIKNIFYDRFGILAIAAIKELKTDHDARLAALEQKLATLGGKS